MEQETHQESNSPFSFLFSAFERMLQDRTPKKVQQFTLPVDIADEGSVYTAQFDIPGYAPESLELLAKGETLTINITQKIQTQDTKVWITRERNSNPASRTVIFPRNAALTLAIAQYEHGLLTITIPKNEEIPVRIPIFSANTRVDAAQGYASNERTETQPLTAESTNEMKTVAPNEYSVVYSTELMSQEDLNRLAQQIVSERTQEPESAEEHQPELFPEFELEEGYEYTNEIVPEAKIGEEISLGLEEETLPVDAASETNLTAEVADVFETEATSADENVIVEAEETPAAEPASQEIDTAVEDSSEPLILPIENSSADSNEETETVSEIIDEELPPFSDNAITQPMVNQSEDDAPSVIEHTQSAAIEEAEQILNIARTTTRQEPQIQEEILPEEVEVTPEIGADSENEAARETIEQIPQQENNVSEDADSADEFLPIEIFRELEQLTPIAEISPAVLPDVAVVEDGESNGAADVLAFTSIAGNSDNVSKDISDTDQVLDPENASMEGGENILNSAADAEIPTNESSDLKKAS